MKIELCYFFLLVLVFLPQKHLSRGKFIQDAASYFANANDSMLIEEQIFFMPPM